MEAGYYLAFDFAPEDPNERHLFELQPRRYQTEADAFEDGVAMDEDEREYGSPNVSWIVVRVP